MTTRRQAAVSGLHWVEAPAISRSTASDIFGAETPIGTWEAIEVAFERFGASVVDLETSRPNNAKNDPQSCTQQQKSVLADLGRALDCIDRVTHVDRLKLSSKHRPFLGDAAKNYSLQHAGRSGLMNVRRELDTM